MKIINRYILKEHIGPFVFALSALTSLLLLQVIARRFGDLVGKGLSWTVIAEFFILSMPYTLAMTIPMALLVAVLYAFSRLAAENEVTALKAGGVSTRSLMIPAVVFGVVLAFFMLWFNDQVLPEANHQLATLQDAIFRTKPTFALRPQVLNTVKESQFYLRAGQIDEGTGVMKDVTIYDVSDGNRRRTVYADSGKLALMPNMRDLTMQLYHGMMLMSPANAPAQIDRIYYNQDLLKIRDVANQFQSANADTTSKGDREMSICEMQKMYDAAAQLMEQARYDSLMAAWRLRTGKSMAAAADPGSGAPKLGAAKPAGGLGAWYCVFVTKYLKVAEASAAELPPQDTTTHKAAATAQDTTKHVAAAGPPRIDSVVVLVGGKVMKVPSNKIPAAAMPAVPSPSTASPGANPGANPAAAAVATTLNAGARMELTDAHMRLEEARYRHNRAGVEIQKKFSLAFACIVFVLVGAPLAIRFPRGGVGMVIGASFTIFAVYYVCLTGLEPLANNSLISPFWAEWGDNILFLIIAAGLISRMGRESGSGRGGGLGEMIDGTRAWFDRVREQRAKSRGATAKSPSNA